MAYRELIAQMTLEEKASLLSGQTAFTTKEVERLGVPSMCLSDGPHGLRRQAGESDHLGLHASLPATCYPTAATVANSWDPALGEELGRYLGREAAAQGVSVLLGPGLNLKRSPLCGRNFEYFSEDPYLSGKMAAAYIRGIQSQGVAACPKHFAANSQETLRMHSDSVVDQRTLRELYLTAFEIAVKEGRPLALMTAYNRVNGVYANERADLLTGVLREEWGFDGFVVTDWGGSNDHVAGVAAGSALEMPAAGPHTDREIVAAVREGRLPEEMVDRRVEEYLKVLYATRPPQGADFDREAHHAFARRAAAESAVLLKNRDGLLPLARGTRVAVIGDFARTPRYQGAGSSAVNATRVDSPLDCLKESGLEVVGFAPGFRRGGGEDDELRDQAVELARKADVVLLFLGLDEGSESEGVDRDHMALPLCQGELVRAVSAVNPRVAAVLCGGAPFEMDWEDCCQAVVHGYLGGQAGAGAMADILTGAANPSGKLAESWPMALADTPCTRYYPGREATSEYREGLYVGYRYYATAGVAVRYPFGYGLSYTSFAYRDLVLREDRVTFTLTNTGERPGAEVAQVYVSRRDGAVFRPERELKGFAKVSLKPGESRQVEIPLDDKAFRYFNVDTGRFEEEGGTYRILVGASSVDIRLEGTVERPGTGAPAPQYPHSLPSYRSGRVEQVGDEEFAALLGRPIPPARWDRTAPLGLNDTFSQLCYARGWVGKLTWRVLEGKLRRARKKGEAGLNLLFVSSMPFRALAKMTGGAMDLEMARAVVEIFNGGTCRGLAHLAGAWNEKRRGDRKSRHIRSGGGEKGGNGHG